MNSPLIEQTQIFNPRRNRLLRTREQVLKQEDNDAPKPESLDVRTKL